jgi:uncharacterized membrane protein (DUF2068 family)
MPTLKPSLFVGEFVCKPLISARISLAFSAPALVLSSSSLTPDIERFCIRMAKQGWFLKVIIWELSIKGLLLFLLSAGLLSLINKDLDLISKQLAQDLNLDVDKYYINLLLSRVGMVKTTLLVEVSIGMFLYGTLSWIEAYGLHKRKRWGEYLTAIATALFIPLEVYEVVYRLSIARLAVLILNVVIVYYLIKHKELFPKKLKAGQK